MCAFLVALSFFLWFFVYRRVLECFCTIQVVIKVTYISLFATATNDILLDLKTLELYRTKRFKYLTMLQKNNQTCEKLRAS